MYHVPALHHSVKTDLSPGFILKGCTIHTVQYRYLRYIEEPQGTDPHPPSSTRGKAGRNHLNMETTPLLPTGMSERYSQTISNLGHAALLRRCELTQGALQLIQYSVRGTQKTMRRRLSVKLLNNRACDRLIGKGVRGGEGLGFGL
jgi:hypothetical protein